MVDERIESVLAQCRQNGLAWAKVFIQDQEYSHYGLDVRYWIAEQERKEQESREAEQKRLAEEAISEARRAADVARDAAIASRRSASWTMWAAIATAAGALFQLIGMLLG